VKNDLKKYRTKALADEAKSYAETYGMTLDEAKSLLKSRHPFSRLKVDVRLRCESGKTFSEATFLKIIEREDFRKEKPKSAVVDIAIGTVELKIKMLDDYFRKSIVVTHSPDVAVTRKAAKSIELWSKARRKFKMIDQTATPAFFMGFATVVFCLLGLKNLIVTTSEKSAYEKSARDLLGVGISDANINQAMELILRFQANVFETEQKFVFPFWYLALFFGRGSRSLFTDGFFLAPCLV
jgi:hypothetical protein